MKKCLFLALFLISASAVMAEQVVIQTKNSTMVLNVEATNSHSTFIMVQNLASLICQISSRLAVVVWMPILLMV